MAAAHKPCIDIVNKNDEQYKFVPVLYDNFSKYDNQMLFNEPINTKNDEIKVSVIPRTDKKLCQLTTVVSMFSIFLDFN